jgi:hypothetical protein
MGRRKDPMKLLTKEIETELKNHALGSHDLERVTDPGSTSFIGKVKDFLNDQRVPIAIQPGFVPVPISDNTGYNDQVLPETPKEQDPWESVDSYPGDDETMGE